MRTPVAVCALILVSTSIMLSQETGSVTDIEGNTYNTIKIGSQVWMAEDLVTTTYNTGESILENPDSQSNIPGYYLSIDWAERDTLAILYNWYVVNTENLCPDDWHVPNDDEWKELEIFLGMSQSEIDKILWRGIDEGGKLKESGTGHWKQPNTAATNETGFKALAFGVKTYGAANVPEGQYNYGAWWTSSDFSGLSTWCRMLSYDQGGIRRVYADKRNGSSVRCIKDVEIFPPTVETGRISDLEENRITLEMRVSSDGNADVTEFGLYWGTGPDPRNTGKKVVLGEGTGSFSHALMGLTGATEYYWIAYAINIAGEALGEVNSFTTLADRQALVSTSIGSVSANTAHVGGILFVDESVTVSETGVYWGTSEDPVSTGSKFPVGNSKGEFQGILEDLLPNTSYFIVSYAITSSGEVRGDELGFTTLEDYPGIVTSEPMHVTTQYAQLGGEVLSDGGSEVSDYGIYWGANPNFAGTRLSLGSGIGKYSYVMEGLQQNTTYYVKSYAINNMGATIGEVVSFTTLPEVPSVEIIPVQERNVNSVVVEGMIIDDGGLEIIEKGFYWGTSPDPAITGKKMEIGSGLDDFSATISGLDAETTYYVTAYARNEEGEATGEEISFITFGLLTDNEGNNYHTIQIGEQVWMAENLATTKLSYGASISYPDNKSDWESTLEPGYCWYDNDQEYKNPYGALYNWYAVETGYLCPSGWHVPTDEEWKTLEIVLGMSLEDADRNFSRGAVGDLLKSITGWDDEGSGNNQSGFSALPGGTTHFIHKGILGYWWTSTLSNEYRSYPLHRGVNTLDNSVSRGTSLRESGRSVRCIKDSSSPPPALPEIASQSVDQTGMEGDSMAFTITIGSKYPLMYCWQKDGKDLSDNGRISGVRSKNLTIKNLLLSDAGMYRCWISNGPSKVFSEAAALMVNPIPTETGSMVDADGNVYPTVRMGGMWWMAENLATTSYNDGTRIPHRRTDYEWLQDNSPGYCWYENDFDSYGSKYGAIYNWYALETEKLCPSGWKVPEKGDWMQLKAYLGIRNGDKLKSTDGWPDGRSGNNLSRFNAFPAGFRYSLHGTFFWADTATYYWSNTEERETTAFMSSLKEGDLGISTNHKRAGLSLRCVTGHSITGISLTEHPQSKHIVEGDEVGFSIEATGEGISFQWKKDGVSLEDDNRISGATSSQLRILNSNYTDIGDYRCVVGNPFGELNSEVAKLTMDLTVQLSDAIEGNDDHRFNEFVLFDTVYRVRRYLMRDLPVLKNSGKTINTAFPIITYVPDPEQPDQELAIPDKYRHGMLQNYVYFQFAYQDGRINRHSINNKWNLWAENANALADVYNPNKARNVNLLFAGSNILTSVGLAFLCPSCTPAKFQKVMKVLEITDIILEVGDQTFAVIENVSSRPNDNTMSHVMSAQANISDELMERYSKTTREFNYIRKGFAIADGILTLTKGAVFVRAEYPSLLKAARSAKAFTLAPSTTFGKMALRNGADVFGKSVLDASPLLLGEGYEHLMYNGADEMGGVTTDYIWMGQMHAVVMEAHARIIEKNLEELSDLGNFSSLDELDYAVSSFRYNVMKFYELKNAFAQNVYAMENALRDFGLRGRIAIPAKAVESNRQNMINNRQDHADLVQDVLEYLSVQEFFYNNYPKFGSQPGLKSALNKNSSQTATLGQPSTSISKLYTNHLGNFCAGDSVMMYAEMENMGTGSNEDVVVDVFDNGVYMSSFQAGNIPSAEQRTIPFWYLAKEGSRKITCRVKGDGSKENEKSITLYITAFPGLSAPNIDTIGDAVVFSIQYQSDINTPPEGDQLMLHVDGEQYILSGSGSADFASGVRFHSEPMELDTGYHAYYYTALVKDEWIRLPLAGEFEINEELRPDITILSTLSPTLESDLSGDEEWVIFRWASTTLPADQDYQLMVSHDPTFTEVQVFHSTRGKMAILANSLQENTVYYWKVFAVGENNDTISCDRIRQFVLRSPPKLALKDTYWLCENDTLRIDLSSYFLSFVDGHVVGDTLQLTDEGSYDIQVLNKYEASSSASILIHLNPLPVTDLGSDTAILVGEEFFLNTRGGYQSYLWNTGSTGPEILVDASQAGQFIYTVIVTDDYLCTNTDSVQIMIGSVGTPGVRQEEGELIMYPVPLRDRLVIQFKGASIPEVLVRVYDMNGKEVWQQSYSGPFFDSHIVMDVSKWDKGMYVIQLEGSDYSENIKVIKGN